METTLERNHIRQEGGLDLVGTLGHTQDSVAHSISCLLGNQTEMDELLSIIKQQLNGGADESEGFSQKGHFSKCRIIGKHIVKSFTDHRLDVQELDDLYDGFLRYREGLASLGMNIPKSVLSQKSDNAKTIVFIDEKISDGIHADFEDKLVRCDDLEAMGSHFDAAIEVLMKFSSHEKNAMEEKDGFLLYGADFKPANIAFDMNNDLYLLDLFVPKVRGSDGEILYVETIHALSRDVLEYIHFHKVGILYWFYIKTKAVLESQQENPFLLALLRKKIEVAIIKISGQKSDQYINNLDTPYRELPDFILKGTL